MAPEGLVEVFVVSVESGGSGVLVPLVRGIMGLRSEGQEEGDAEEMERKMKI
jgi:hypothetical protein